MFPKNLTVWRFELDSSPSLFTYISLLQPCGLRNILQDDILAFHKFEEMMTSAKWCISTTVLDEWSEPAQMLHAKKSISTQNQ